MTSTAHSRTGWAGWGVFAAVIMIVSGGFSVLQGLVALIGPNAYFVAARGSLFLFDVTGWGWWNLIIGALLVLAGIALLAGQMWARVVAIILAALSAFGQLMLIPVQPWWALAIIAVDVLVIYAVTAHGRELASAD